MTEYNQQGQHVDKQFNIVGETHIGQIGDRYGLNVEEVALLVVELKRADQPVVWNGKVPYLGLESFRESDAGFFFGREKLVDELLERVQRSPFVVLAGPSGSGKSSVARAGLFHALRQGRLEGSDNWLLASMRPQGDPIGELAVALERAARIDRAGDPLRAEGLTEPATLGRLINLHLGDDPRRRFVLLVDQFEETFTQTHDEAARAAFIQLLTTAAAGDGRAVILLALRADFVSHCARYPDLRAMLNREFQLVGAMDPPDLAKAITLPALEVGAAIDPALVSRIMADMKGEPGALPLMSFALRDLFEAEKTAKGQPMDLTLAEYLNRGGIESALERHANSVFATFTAEQQGLARSIFSRLVEIGQGRVDTRRTVAFAELVPAGADPALVAVTVAELAEQNARLITTGGAGDTSDAAGLASATVTLAHEKLIDAWPWLRQLVDENRESIKLQNEIIEQARSWENHDRDNSYLFSGVRLAAIEEQMSAGKLQLGGPSTHFVEASVTRRRIATRNRRFVMIGLATLALVAGFTAMLALSFAGQSRQNESLAIANAATAEANKVEAERQYHIALARQFAAQSRIEQGDTGLLLALKATMILDPLTGHPLVETEEALRDAMAQWSHWTANLGNHHGIVQSVSFLNDEEMITAGQDGRVVLRSVGTSIPATLLLEIDGPVSSMAVDSARHRLAVGTASGSIHLLDLQDISQSEVVWKAHKEPNPVLTLTFTSDGTALISGGGDNTAKLWQLDDLSQPAITIDSQDWVRDASISSDGRWLAVGGDDHMVRIWDLSMPSLTEPVVTDNRFLARVNALEFSVDNDMVAAGSEDGTIHLIDLLEPADDIRILQNDSIASGVLALAFENESGHLLAGTTAGNFMKITIGQDQPDWDQIAHLGTAIEALDVSPSGQIITTGDRRGTVRTWSLGIGNAEPRVLEGHDERVRALAFIPEQGIGTKTSVLVSASQDGAVKIRSEDGQIHQVLERTGELLYSIDVSPDSRWLVTGGETIQLWTLADLEAGPVELPGHTDEVVSVRFSPDGGTLASGSLDKKIMLWNLADLEAEPKELNGHLGGILTIAFNQTGTTLAAGDEAGYVYLWGLDEQQSGPVQIGEHSGFVRSVTFSPDGRHVVSAGDDGNIHQITITQDTPALIKKVHDGRARWVSFSPDGTIMATAGDDMTVKLWKSADLAQDPVVLRGHQALVRTLAFSADGRRLVSGGDDRLIFLWTVRRDELQEMACARVGANFSENEWNTFFGDEPYQQLCRKEEIQ